MEKKENIWKLINVHIKLFVATMKSISIFYQTLFINVMSFFGAICVCTRELCFHFTWKRLKFCFGLFFVINSDELDDGKYLMSIFMLFHVEIDMLEGFFR